MHTRVPLLDVLASQVIPVQHVLSPVPVQELPTPPQVALITQMPPWQRWSLQQSALATQLCPVERHWHVPPLQIIWPQQSLDVVHEALCSWQQRFELGVGRHEPAVQHCVACEHAAPVATHEPPVHAPALQVCPALHAFPQAPQLAGSVSRFASPVHGPSTQAPESSQDRWRVPQVPHATVIVWPGAHDVQGPSS